MHLIFTVRNFTGLWPAQKTYKIILKRPAGLGLQILIEDSNFQLNGSLLVQNRIR